MLTLGLVGSTRPVLSWDEIATADVTHRSVTQIWNLVHHIDAVFGPYYVLMHAWSALFGDSVLSLRLPSILAMAAAAATTGELGRRLFGSSAGALAGLLFCAIPNMSRYAAEARPYAMACLFSVVSLLLLYRALERPDVGRWAGYTAATVALALCSLVALTALLGHLVVVLARSRSPRWWRPVLPWCVAMLATLLLAAPLVWWGLHQRQEQLHWVPPMTLGAVYTFPAQLTGSTEAAWLLIGMFALAIVRPARAVAEMAGAAVVPMAVLAAISAVGPSFWVNRYLLFVLLPAVIVAAAALTRVQINDDAGLRTLELATFLVVFCIAAVPGQIAVRQPTVKNGSDYRSLAAVIRQQQRAGDDIVFQKGRTMRAGIDFYLRHDSGRPPDVLLKKSAAETATLTATEYADPVTRLAAARRIWLVVYGSRADPATGRPDLVRYLRDQFRRTAVWTAKHGTLALYTRASRPGRGDAAGHG